MKRILSALLYAVLLFSLCACSGNTAPENPAPSPVVTTAAPSPSATPPPWRPPSRDQILDRILETDPTRYISPDYYNRSDSSRPYEVVTADPQLAFALPGLYARWLAEIEATLEEDPHISDVRLNAALPSWQLLATITYGCSGQREALDAALKAASDFEIEIQPLEGAEQYALSVTAAPRNPVDLFYGSETGTGASPLTHLFSYAYLSTVYDDEMNPRDGIGTPALPSLLFPIENPKARYFDDTWYADRDGGARRHTGTDINAPEGTGLLACVDGVIFDAGENMGTGNYVVVRGEDGTQYHYYHMVSPTDLRPGDLVAAGDLVGRVGNTGNSTANHLHFTIITADGHYLNPDTYLLDARDVSAANP